MFTALTLPLVLPGGWETAWRGSWHIPPQSLSWNTNGTMWKSTNSREDRNCFSEVENMLKHSLFQGEGDTAEENYYYNLLQKLKPKWHTQSWPTYITNFIVLGKKTKNNLKQHFIEQLIFKAPVLIFISILDMEMRCPKVQSSSEDMSVPFVTITSSTSLTFTIHTCVNLSPNKGHEPVLTAPSHPAKQHKKGQHWIGIFLKDLGCSGL